MKSIKIFMPGKRDVQKEVFTLELSRLLPQFSFCPEYENNDNPYIIEDLLSESTCAFVIAFSRSDTSNLTIMALNKNLPILFLLEETITDMPIEKHYFLVRMAEMKKGRVADLIKFNATHEGASRLAIRMSNFLKD